MRLHLFKLYDHQYRLAMDPYAYPLPNQTTTPGKMEWVPNCVTMRSRSRQINLALSRTSHNLSSPKLSYGSSTTIWSRDTMAVMALASCVKLNILTAPPTYRSCRLNQSDRGKTTARHVRQKANVARRTWKAEKSYSNAKAIMLHAIHRHTHPLPNGYEFTASTTRTISFSSHDAVMQLSGEASAGHMSESRRAASSYRKCKVNIFLGLSKCQRVASCTHSQY